MSKVCQRCYHITHHPCQSDTEALDCPRLKRAPGDEGARRRPNPSTDAKIAARARSLYSDTLMGGIASNATLDECVTYIVTGQTVEDQREEHNHE